MNHRGGVVGLIALAGLCVGASVLACGDKFLVSGRGARFQRGGSHTLVVLIYAPPSSVLKAGTEDVSFEKTLSRAGYHPAIAATPEELAKAMKESAPGLVLAGIADAGAVEKLALAGTERPAIVPVLAGSSRQEFAEARKTWGVALRSPASGDSLLDAVDEAVERRAKEQKQAAPRI